MTDAVLLSSWKDIQIQINETEYVKGVLNFYNKSGTFYFTWDLDDESILITKLPSFFIIFHQIYSIQIKPMSISKTGLIFVFKDFAIFPLLIFSSMSATHFISYLLSKKMISKNGNQMLVTATVKLQPSLDEKYVHSSRFISLVQHTQVLLRLFANSQNLEQKEEENQKIITFDELNKKYIDENGKFNDFETIFDEIQTKNRKLDESSRSFLWPLLLDVYPKTATKSEKEEINQKNLKLYNRLFQIRMSFTTKQNEKFESILKEMQQNLSKLEGKEKMTFYVKQMINDVLMRYIILCADVGYHKTMESIVYAFCFAFIDKIDEKGNKIYTNDFNTYDRDSFCAFLLSCLKNYLNIGCRVKLLENDEEAQKFFAERENKIIEVTHVQLHQWLTLYGLTGVEFLFNNSANGFSNLFDGQKLVELWDFSFSSQYSSSFYVLFSAALLILSFDKLFLQTSLQFDDFQNDFNKVAENIDISLCLTLTKNIIRILKNRGSDTAWIFIPLKQNQELLDFVPKYINIIKQ